MARRYLKVVFVGLISLLCLFYAVRNVVNVEACYQAFAYVLGAVNHQVYTHQLVPATQNPVATWLALALIVSCEFLAGLLAAKGAWDLWRTRKAPSAEFNDAKTFALVGCGLGIVV